MCLVSYPNSEGVKGNAHMGRGFNTVINGKTVTSFKYLTEKIESPMFIFHVGSTLDDVLGVNCDCLEPCH